MEVLPEQSFSKRMQIIIDYVGSAEKLAKLSNMSARVIGKYLSGESDPSRNRLIALAKAGNVNTRWLAEGEGPIKRGTLESPNNIPGLTVEYKKISEQNSLTGIIDQHVELKVYALAGAGHPNELIDSEPVAEIVVPKDFYKPSIVPVKIRGRSMEDTIMDGAIVGVDRADKWVVSGEIFAVWMPYEGAVVKRLYLDTEKITCKSDNSKFSDFMIPLDKVDEHFIQGRVKWVIQQY